MKIFRDIENLPAFRDPVVTIGTFDGVHMGHQQIIQRINELADIINGESILVTFAPHPRLVLQKDASNLQLITTLEEKAELLQEYGLDNLVITPFTQAFSEYSATEYIEDFLVRRFHPRKLVIGYDHHFGHNREGNIRLLKEMSGDHDFEVEEISKQLVDDIAVSSTKIRNALLKGDILKAEKLLGHPFSVTGVVTKGEKIGRKLGFPTANLIINNPHKLIPSSGIYAVKVIHDQREYGGMYYRGTRSTYNGLSPTLEVHIFGFKKEIYNEKLTVRFIQRIREDERFESEEALQRQLEQDKEVAMKVLEE